jgi:hypothetical protein
LTELRRAPAARARWASFILLALLLGIVPATLSYAQQIWFGPRIPFRSIKGEADWNTMFEPDADWANTLAHINVFILGDGYITDTPDATLVAQFRFFRDHDIKVALAIQSVGKTPACPGASEGYNTPLEGASATAKLKRLGLPLDYIRLDEPVWFGHYDSDRGACQYPAKDLARQVFLVVNEYLKNFPNAAIGEVEPVPVMTSKPDWQAQYQAWRREFEAISGRRIAFLHIEVHTRDPAWAGQLQDISRVSRALGEPFGVIYNSSGPDSSDRDWISHTTELFDDVESRLGIIPDHAVLQTWEARPSHVFPPTSDSTLSHLILEYLLPRTRIAIAQERERRVSGQVLDTSEGNRPIATAHVTVETTGLDGAQSLPLRSFSGTVPPTARSALMGIRVNTECNCADTNDVLIGAFTYKETDGGTASAEVDFPGIAQLDRQVRPGITVRRERRNGEPAVHIVTDRTSPYSYNSARFSVTPNARFVFTVPVGGPPGKGLSGYVTLIWFDADGHGISRIMLRAPAEYKQVASLVTGPDGRFSLPRPVADNGTPAPLRFELAGSATYRGAFANLP